MSGNALPAPKPERRETSLLSKLVGADMLQAVHLLQAYRCRWLSIAGGKHGCGPRFKIKQNVMEILLFQHAMCRNENGNRVTISSQYF